MSAVQNLSTLQQQTQLSVSMCWNDGQLSRTPGLYFHYKAGAGKLKQNKAKWGREAGELLPSNPWASQVL